MNCPKCKLTISEIDEICPFCGYIIREPSGDKLSSDASDNSTLSSEKTDNLTEPETDKANETAAKATEAESDDFAFSTLQTAESLADISYEKDNGKSACEVSNKERINTDTDSFSENISDFADESLKKSENGHEATPEETVNFVQSDDFDENVLSDNKAEANDDFAADEDEESITQNTSGISFEESNESDFENDSESPAEAESESGDISDEKAENVYADEQTKNLYEKPDCIDKIIDFIPGNEHFEKNGLQSDKKISIAAALPFMFWLPLISKRDCDDAKFYANHSFASTIIFIINCMIWFLFNLLPFTKTVGYENMGITYFKSIYYMPWFAIMIVSVLFAVWALVSVFNVLCALKNRKKNFFSANFIHFYH